MNHTLYSYAKFFAILGFILFLYQGLLYLYVGPPLYFFESFIWWYVSSFVVSLIGLLLVLRYYRYKKYVFPFWSLLASIVTSSVQFLVILSMLLGHRQLGSFYPIVVMTALGIAIVYSVSLYTLPAGKHKWLRAGGMLTLVLSSVLLVTMILAMDTSNAQRNVVVDYVIRWTSLAGSVIPLFFALNFREELKGVEAVPARPSVLENALVFAGALSIVAVLIFGTNVFREAGNNLSWERHQSLKAKEWNKLFVSRSYTESGADELRYQLLTPFEYDSTRKYPLVVCLPYGGGVEGSPAAQWLFTDANRRAYPSFVLVPFCPNGKGWGGIPNYPTLDTVVFSAMAKVEAEYPSINTKRIYVTGVSRGGYGSWHFISLRPDLFAAALPVCGGGDPTTIVNAADVPVWAFHGENDRNVPVESSRLLIDALRNAGGSPKYTEFEGEGHNIWDKVMSTSGVLEWLYAQEKK